MRRSQAAPPPAGFRAVPDALPQELNLQGEVVAIVVAETEDLAAGRGRCHPGRVRSLALRIDAQGSDGSGCGRPGSRKRQSSAARQFARKFPNATWAEQQGDLEKGFAEADVIKEFTYRFAGAVSVPMQPSGSVAKWDGDRLTFWGMGQGIYPPCAKYSRRRSASIASKIRFINKYNGSTFGSARLAAERFYPSIAHLAKVTGRPVKVMLPKDQELAQLLIKPETITKFKVGAKKDGRITAIDHEVYVSGGDLEFGGHADGPGTAT